MQIWLNGKSKKVLLFHIDEDAIMLAYARLQSWVKQRRKRTGRKPKELAQGEYLRRQYRKIMKAKA